MTTSIDFRGADGHIDWKAYEDAQIETGERCHRCRMYIPSCPRQPGQRLCHDCDSLLNHESESDHERMVRCPHCRHVFNAMDHGVWEAARNCHEDHKIFCPSCDKVFTVGLQIMIKITSPDVIERPPAEEEDDDTA